MDNDIFCVLCGGPFALEQHVYRIDPSKKGYQWLYDVRLLSATSALHTLRMTSVGETHTNLSGDDTIFLSEKTCWSITDADCFQLDASFYHVLAIDEAGDAMFPLHNSCVTIACHAIESHASDLQNAKSGSYIAQLYNILNGRLQANNAAGASGPAAYDFFALRGNGVYGPRSVLGLDELSWWSGAYDKFFVDPLTITNFVPTVLKALHPIPPERNPISSTVTLNRPQRGLEALPIELLDQVMSQLSARSTLSLRRSSRTLAFKIPLDERFWRRYLCNGSLLPHVWDLDEKLFKSLLGTTPHGLTWDWRDFTEQLRVNNVLKITSQSNAESLPVGFWNRCRIWHIIGSAHKSPSGYDANEEPQTSKVQVSQRKSRAKRIFAIGLSTILVMAAWWDLKPMLA